MIVPAGAELFSGPFYVQTKNKKSNFYRFLIPEFVSTSSQHQFPTLELRNRNRTRSRRVTYFNPPFSLNVETNVGKEFLRIIKSFPRSNVLYPIVNSNTIKISYRTLQNMGGEISRHDNNILGGLEETPAPRCNCRAANKPRCPLPNYCTVSCVVYRALVTNEVDNSVATYTGLTEIPSNCQLGSMRLISGATSLMILTTTHQVQG